MSLVRDDFLNFDNNPVAINIITTGGTIDKLYDESDGTLENRTSAIKDVIVPKLRLPYTKLYFHPILSKDSLLMTDKDRKLIFNFIETLLPANKPIVILHGTDTMAVTALFCYQKIKRINVPIIFTGAMRPLGFERSDATQNITEALYASRILPGGVYLSFHGKLYHPEHVRKNKVKKTFEVI